MSHFDRPKTKKNRKKSEDNQKLWNAFEEAIPSDKSTTQSRIECIYRTVGEREECEACGSSLSITPEGFLGCVNDKCGILYKDMIDQTAEWRYYGADDNGHSDPTRCGMPVNPLLRESSYGCKVILRNGSSSYEMRKIRRYTEYSLCLTERNLNMMSFSGSQPWPIMLEYLKLLLMKLCGIIKKYQSIKRLED